MNLLCPNCQKMIQVSDQYAGQEVRCPLCNGTFTVPVVPEYHATPIMPSGQGGSTSGPPVPPSTPSVQPITEAYSLTPPEAAGPSAWHREEPKRTEEVKPPRREPPPLFPDSVALPQLTPGYQHLYSIWISPRVVKWIPLAALALVFLSMFSTWIVFVGRPEDRLTGWQIVHNGAGTFYVLLFLVSLLLALASAVLPRVPRDRLPPWVPQFLPWSSAIVGGGVLVAFIFLLMSLGSGYGADAATELGTGWLRFSVVCLIVAVLSAALDLWLTLRGQSQPLPRIDVTW